MLAAWGIVAGRKDGRIQLASACALVLFVLSLGPYLGVASLENPLYFAARSVVPGFWRVAKPEVFFLGTWLLLSLIAAIQLARLRPSARTITVLYGIFVVAWLIMVRSHPAYPPMTLPKETRLDPNWAEKVFK